MILLSIALIARKDFSFWYRKFKSNLASSKFLQIKIACQTRTMDFDALMQKKLGGKYLKPGRGEPEDSAKDVTPTKNHPRRRKRPP